MQWLTSSALTVVGLTALGALLTAVGLTVLAGKWSKVSLTLFGLVRGSWKGSDKLNVNPGQ